MLRTILVPFLFLVWVAAPVAADDEELPEGPIRDRHELMEEIGANAKKIGNAMKVGATDEILEPAQALQEAAPKVLDLFPKGSQHPRSRALAAIWADWTQFERANARFEAAAGGLVAAAENGGPFPPAVKKLFDSCKGCHESFREPED